MDKADGPLFSPEETRTIFGTSAVFALRMLGMSMVLPVFTIFANQLYGANHFLSGLALGAYGLTQAATQVPLGRWSDRLGRKPVVLICLSIFCGGSILAALAHNIYLLIFARLLQGAGAISSVAYAWIADVIGADRRSRAIAYIGMGIGISLAFGLIVGPTIGGIFGLRSLFWICAFTSFLSILYMIFFMENPPRKEPHVDIDFDTTQFRSGLGNRDLWALYLCGFLSYSTLTAVFFMLPLLLKNYLEPVNFWMLLLPISALGMVTMISSSHLADQGKTRTVLVVGFLLVIYTGTSLIFSGSYLVVYLAIFAYYLGYSILEPILATAVTKFARPDIRGTTVGIFNMFQAIGNFFGGILAGGLYLLHRELLFGAIAIIGFLGLLAILSLRLKHKPGF